MSPRELIPYGIDRSVTPHRKIDGFTLIELLVALFVASAMFALGYGALTDIARHRIETKNTQTSLSDVQRTIRVIIDDISQLNPRPIRDQIGRTSIPALLAEPGTPSRFALTRGGRVPTSMYASSSLQRVEYILENSRLVRLVWPVLDSAQSTDTSRRVLMRSVRGLELRYLDDLGEWRKDWPPAVSGEQNGLVIQRVRPKAIEVVLLTEGHGTLRRLIEVPR
ncbi:MAG: type II secretion system protein GspJ [Gammaproteobacteria bacterium]|nr:type II secretion system protein GspJ [Gammaproteobacteria bacterium]